MMNLIDMMRTVIILCVAGVLHAKPPERNLCNNTKILKKSLQCKPRRVFVNILPDNGEIQPQIFAYVVQVNRCFGFDGKKRCVSDKSVNVTVHVQLVESRKCEIFLVEQHTRCKLKPIQSTIKAQVCGPRKRWSKEKSQCVCYSECTTGSFFNEKTCRCVKGASQIIS